MTAKKKKKKDQKNRKNGDGVTHAILFRYRGTNPKKKALVKKVQDKNANDVVYYYLQTPMYYKLKGDTWVHYTVPEGQTPAFDPGDSVIFVFDDRSRKAAKHAAIGVVIDFQQAIGPFDDEVMAEVRMAAAIPYKFKDRNGTRKTTYALAWKLEHPPAGFALESDGLYDYTVSVLTFNPPSDKKGKGKGKRKGRRDDMSEARSLRFWRDPTMCVGGACSG